MGSFIRYYSCEIFHSTTIISTFTFPVGNSIDQENYNQKLVVLRKTKLSHIKGMSEEIKWNFNSQNSESIFYAMSTRRTSCQKKNCYCIPRKKTLLNILTVKTVIHWKIKNIICRRNESRNSGQWKIA